jgi:hypothetical protein
MKIYNYDLLGIYINESEATESPLEPGVFLCPAKATFKEPPSEIGKVAVFADNKWTLKEDNRGKVVYNKETKVKSVVDYLGEIKETETELVPGKYDKWEVDKWVIDETYLNEVKETKKDEFKKLLTTHIETEYNVAEQRTLTAMLSQGNSDAQAVFSWITDNLISLKIAKDSVDTLITVENVLLVEINLIEKPVDLKKFLDII